MPVVGPSEPAAPPPAAAKAGPAGPPPRVFPEDVPLREAIGLRCRALAEDLRVPEQCEALAVVVGLTAALLYSYWPGLVHASSAWNNAQYSHGWIVPLFTLAILFWWRQPVAPVARSARIAGLVLLGASLVLRLLVARYRIITIDMYTFVPAVAGAILAGGGWSMFRWACVPVGFLIFMYPLPDEATRYLLGPLQTLATMMSTYALQTIGLDAYREGNKIVLGDSQVLGVVDACSGLRMLTIFVWLALMIVLIGGGEWWENLVIAASAIPIALVVNATRITVTGVMYTINPEWAEKIFHDWAGYFMMPMALGFLFLLQSILKYMVVTEELAPATVVGGGRPAAMAAVVAKPARAGGVVSVVARPDPPGTSG